jgi:hypothetical protein
MVMITLRASWLDVIENDVPSTLEVVHPQALEGEKRRFSNISSEIFNDSPKSNSNKESEYFREGVEDDEDLNRELEMIESDNESEYRRQVVRKGEV